MILARNSKKLYILCTKRVPRICYSFWSHTLLWFDEIQNITWSRLQDFSYFCSKNIDFLDTNLGMENSLTIIDFLKESKQIYLKMNWLVDFDFSIKTFLFLFQVRAQLNGSANGDNTHSSLDRLMMWMFKIIQKSSKK